MYDVIILGSGPAGLTAGIYAARGGKKCAVLAGVDLGGQATKTHKIENYSGVANVEGFALMSTMLEQAMSFNVEIMYEQAVEVFIDGKIKKVRTDTDTVLETKSLIIATGAKPRKLGVDREDELIGKGIAYCATCDGGFFREKPVAVAGGGNTAFTSALYLSNLCSKVYLVHRRQGFRAAQILVDRARANSKIEFVLDSTIKELIGDKSLNKIVVYNSKTKEDREIDVDAVFVSLGTIPNVDFLDGKVELDEYGQIKADTKMNTNVKGVFAAGDVRNTPLKQVITACADGAIAAESAMAYLEEM
ncbi:MAG: thioredoxin-disulfide reductase [Christensenellales bacterium]|nr:thioredoxin-disulfide reductase [Clostridiales bacterium]